VPGWVGGRPQVDAAGGRWFSDVGSYRITRSFQE
jgi:hypothetical protein